MADLLDIHPVTAVEIVKIDGQRVKVRGVSIDAIAALIAQSPNLRELINGNVGESFFVHLIEGVGAAAAPIIAAGCGHAGDKEYERHAAQLLPEQQIKLLRAIWGLTFPNGLSSFVEELTSLMNGAGEGARTYKLRRKQSPSILPPSSEAAGSHPTVQ